MKNSTSIFLSICGGAVIGSAITCIVHKYGKLDKDKIHKKIIAEIGELRSYIKSEVPNKEAEDSSCICND